MEKLHYHLPILVFVFFLTLKSIFANCTSSSSNAPILNEVNEKTVSDLTAIAEWREQFSTPDNSKTIQLSDEFPLNVEIIPTKAKADEIPAKIENPFIWTLMFVRETPGEVMKKYFSSFPAEEQMKVKKFLEKNMHCGFLKTGRRSKCDENTRYDRIEIFRIIPDKTLAQQVIEIAPLSENLDYYLKIPAKLYTSIIEKKAGNSYDLFIEVPSTATDQQLHRAALYFNQIIPGNKAELLLAKARSHASESAVARVSVTEFFPVELKSLPNRFDYSNNDNCHSIALSFADSAFRLKRGLINITYTSMTLLYGDNSGQNISKNFIELSNNEPLKYGDIIQFGTSHSMTYLFHGIVFMKDDEGSQWSYRFARLSDIADVQDNRTDYIKYRQYAPIRILRRTDTPLLLP